MQRKTKNWVLTFLFSPFWNTRTAQWIFVNPCTHNKTTDWLTDYYTVGSLTVTTGLRMKHMFSHTSTVQEWSEQSATPNKLKPARKTLMILTGYYSTHNMNWTPCCYNVLVGMRRTHTNGILFAILFIHTCACMVTAQYKKNAPLVSFSSLMFWESINSW